MNLLTSIVMPASGLLPRVRWVSSVSGGSILNGLLAVSHKRIAAAGFAPETLDSEVIASLAVCESLPAAPYGSLFEFQHLSVGWPHGAWCVRTSRGRYGAIAAKWYEDGEFGLTLKRYVEMSYVLCAKPRAS